MDSNSFKIENMIDAMAPTKGFTVDELHISAPYKKHYLNADGEKQQTHNVFFSQPHQIIPNPEQ